MLKQLDFSLPDESTYEDMEDDNLSFSLPSDVSYEQTELTSLPSNSDYVDTPDEAGYTEEDLGSYQEDFLEEEEDDISYIKLEPTFELTSLGEDYSVANLAKHKGVVDMVNSYLTKRNGEEGKQQEGESDEDVIEKMLTHFRYVEGNTIDTMQEVDFLKDSKTTKKTKDNFNLLYTMYQEIPNFTSEGGGSFFSGASDVLSAAIFDPAVVVGLGFGGPIGSALTTAVKQAGKGATTRAILRQAMKGNMGKITAMTSVEGLIGAMGESQRQEVKLEVDLMASKDWEMIGTMGAVSGVASLVGFPLGVAGAKKALATAGVKSGDQKVAERLAKAKVTKGKVKEDKDNIANYDPVTGELFDVERANRIRDKLGMPGSPLSLSIMNDISSLPLCF